MAKVTQDYLEARRRQLLDAAVRCFARAGFHKTTMVDIARQAGLSTGASYRYFASKEELIEAIAAERHSREAGLEQRAASLDGATARLSELARGYFEMLGDPGEQERRRLGVEIWAEALRNPRIGEIVRRGVDRPRESFRRILEDARDRGELPPALDPEAGARVMVALFQGFVLQQAWDPHADVDAYLGAVVVIIDSLVAAGERAA